jgi:hypothetical protein
VWRRGAARRGAAWRGVAGGRAGGHGRGCAERRARDVVWGCWLDAGSEAGRDGRVAAGSITETAGRAAERATKGDENFPAAAKVLSARRLREKFAENGRPRRTSVQSRRRAAPGAAASYQRYAFFIGAPIARRDRI